MPGFSHFLTKRVFLKIFEKENFVAKKSPKNIFETTFLSFLQKT